MPDSPTACSRVMLTDRVAMVTGAGMGMGRATAILMAQRGANVVVSDIREDSGRETVEKIVADGGQAVFVRCDVSSEDDVARLIAESVARYGRLDCAVNNAAITPDTHGIPDMDRSEAGRVLGVNLMGLLFCMKYEMRQFQAQKSSGAIVNIGSVSSARPQPNNVAYVAAKHGVVGATKTGALEGSASNIRVNAVLPGAIDTPMMRKVINAAGLNETDVAPTLSLFARFGRPEEVAEASAWLCSDAASFVTGHALAVDGGYLAS